MRRRSAMLGMLVMLLPGAIQAQDRGRGSYSTDAETPGAIAPGQQDLLTGGRQLVAWRRAGSILVMLHNLLRG